MKPKWTKSRFWHNTKRVGSCLEWCGAKDKNGYGKLTIEYKTVRAHRAAYLWSRGTIPIGFCILHKCDNPPCVRPSHLYIGTLSDNTNDAYKRGRLSKRGEKHHLARLTESSVRKIKKQKGKGSVWDVAESYGVSHWTIYDVWRGRSWSHV
jgi:hypothetical protein